MTAPDPRVIEKIQKVLAMAASANEHEAALATARAHELLVKHNLTLEQVTNSGTEQESIEIEASIERYNEKWRRILFVASCDLYFCKYLFQDEYIQGVNTQRVQKGIRHCIVGKPHNAVVARMMSEYLVSTVNRLANDGARDYFSRQFGRGPTSTERGRYVNTFRIACAIRLRQRMQELRKKAEEGSATDSDGKNLPALRNLYLQELSAVEQWVNQRYDLHNAKSRPVSIRNKQAVKDAVAAADQVNLSPQIGGGQSNDKLPPRTHLIGHKP